MKKLALLLLLAIVITVGLVGPLSSPIEAMRSPPPTPESGVVVPRLPRPEVYNLTLFDWLGDYWQKLIGELCQSTGVICD